MVRFSSFHFSENDNTQLKAAGLKVGAEIDNKDLFTALKKIYKKTTLNVMVVRSGEDITIFVDTGRFRTH